MRERRRSNLARSRRARFDDKRSEKERGEDEQIVVHVHVHRDGRRSVADVSSVPPPPPGPVDRARRPVLTGQLFEWQGHYDLVAQRHLEAGTRPATLWTAVAAAFRQARALVVTFAALVLIRRS